MTSSIRQRCFAPRCNLHWSPSREHVPRELWLHLQCAEQCGRLRPHHLQRSDPTLVAVETCKLLQTKSLRCLSSGVLSPENKISAWLCFSLANGTTGSGRSAPESNEVGPPSWPLLTKQKLPLSRLTDAASACAPASASALAASNYNARHPNKPAYFYHVWRTRSEAWQLKFTTFSRFSKVLKQIKNADFHVFDFALF